jgi:hypothetical protein
MTHRESVRIRKHTASVREREKGGTEKRKEKERKQLHVAIIALNIEKRWMKSDQIKNIFEMIYYPNI